MRELLLILGSLLTGALAVYLIFRTRPGNRIAGSRTDLSGEGIRAEEVLERMGEGALVLDQSLGPVFANRAARYLLGFQSEGLPPRVPSEEIAALADRALDERDVEARVDVWFPQPMSLHVRALALGSGSEILVLLQNVTQEVLAQRVRREFVAHASHELKSPVASLQAVSEALESALADDPEAARRFSDRMMHETDRLGQLVRDLLDLSRLEDPAGVPDEPVDLSDVAKLCWDEIKPDVEAKNIEADAQIVEDVWVVGDEQQLGLMIRNLLENAIRYTPEAGTISLAVTQSDGDALVRVIDNGIGIPREAHGRVFERFYRVDRGRTRERGGTGLGLAIVKHVAELHGGTVGLSSELGGGSDFTARLPALDRSAGQLASAAG